jgi:erythrin-vacuolar iron transport family protein
MRSFESLDEREILIAWVRHKYMDTPWSSAITQVVFGGLLVFGVGILIGSS